MKHLFSPLVMAAFAFGVFNVASVQAQEADDAQHYVAIAVKPSETPDCEADDCEALFQETVKIIERRLGVFEGSSLLSIAYEGGARIGMVVSGRDHLKTVRAVIGVKDLAFLLVSEDIVHSEVERQTVPDGIVILPFQNREYDGFIAVYRDGGIAGNHIAHAISGFDSYTNAPVVNIKFDEEGTRKFAELTTANVGKRFAIVLDGTVLSAPFISEPILGGQAQISASQSQEETVNLAIAIGAGGLPVPFVIVEDRTLGE